MQSFILRLPFCVVVALAFACGVAAPAHAMSSSGINCRPTSDADWAKVSYSRAWGIQNNSASPATVICPVTMSPVPDEDVNIIVDVYDRNTSTNVECSLLATNNNGDLIGSFPINSAGGGPGTSVQSLSRTFRQPGAFALVLQCVIPPAEGGWFSHVTSYSVPSHGTINRHASACVPIDNTHRGRIAYTVANGVYNSAHSGPATVVCDLTDSFFFAGWVGPVFFGYDRSTQGDITCTFRLSNFDGIATDPEFTGQSSGNSNSAQGIGGTLFTSGAQMFTAECAIPQLMPTSNFLSSIHIYGR
jgi:hypothetical protein